MKIDALFEIQICPVTYKSGQRESKINCYSWFSSRGTSRLIKWIYKERYELLLLKGKQNLKGKGKDKGFYN